MAQLPEGTPEPALADRPNPGDDGETALALKPANHSGRISGGILDVGTTTTVWSTSLCAVPETMIPGRTLPISGGCVSLTSTHKTVPRFRTRGLWAR